MAQIRVAGLPSLPAMLTLFLSALGVWLDSTDLPSGTEHVFFLGQQKCVKAGGDWRLILYIVSCTYVLTPSALEDGSSEVVAIFVLSKSRLYVFQFPVFSCCMWQPYFLLNGSTHYQATPPHARYHLRCLSVEV